MDEMLKDFVIEALDLATNVEEHLLGLEKTPGDLEILNAVFRSFHTIKGGAGFMNLPALVSACHLTENLFDALRTGKAQVTPFAIEASLQASSFVADQLQALFEGVNPSDLPAMPNELEVSLTEAIAGRIVEGKQRISDKQSIQNNSLAEIDWNAYYSAVLPSISTGSTSKESEPTSTQGWDGSERRSNAPVKEESIRIDAIKLDSLLEVAGESVQAANQAGVLLEKLAQYPFEGKAAELMTRLQETLGRASRYSSELQRATLATRMQPVGRLFQKFPRLVRELAKELGKEVDLRIEGAETEVDRVVVDSLYDPLVHMLRNSLDHGIEDSQSRKTSGKPPKAVICLKAWQEANSVVIVIEDDGRGMNPSILREKAVAKGLISAAQELSDSEAYQLVFLPGFSTKEVASSVSGRGVGMDVVKTAVEKNRGVIQIESELGKGTRFVIRLPIELSIVPTMLVNTAGALLGLPMSTVKRVLELPDTFKGVGGAPVLMDQGVPLPVRSLAAILGYTPTEEKVGIVVAADSPYILAVGNVDGTADLVIKPFTAIAANGVSGTARSAEGDLVLVVGASFLVNGCT